MDDIAAVIVECTHIVVDVPIGLPERKARECDVAARKKLKGRGSSVFPAPIRGVLSAQTHRQMCDRWFEIEERKGSKQLFGILPLIRRVDERMNPGSAVPCKGRASGGQLHGDEWRGAQPPSQGHDRGRG